MAVFPRVPGWCVDPSHGGAPRGERFNEIARRNFILSRIHLGRLYKLRKKRLLGISEELANSHPSDSIEKGYRRKIKII